MRYQRLIPGLKIIIKKTIVCGCINHYTAEDKNRFKQYLRKALKSIGLAISPIADVKKPVDTCRSCDLA
jgi:hypothetical protein